MPSVLLAAALWGAMQATAVDAAFDQRVQQGRQAELGPVGQAYQARLWARLNPLATTALTDCLTSLPAPDKAPFTLVADLDEQGRPQQLQERPPTPLAACFAQRFAGMLLPLPPASSGAGYPIEIDISITQ
jgi:hypothetical protein